jgi:hypothetical protein
VDSSDKKKKNDEDARKMILYKVCSRTAVRSDEEPDGEVTRRGSFTGLKRSPIHKNGDSEVLKKFWARLPSFDPAVWPGSLPQRRFVNCGRLLAMGMSTTRPQRHH